MYLSDRDIKALLPEIGFETDDPNQPFIPADQIQPCSVDLRLGRTFWKQRSKQTLDLRRSKLLELSPRHHWERIVLDPGETITLRSQEMLLGRTLETFTIPNLYAGKLEGRSSFARMGLAVHCTADFINPGYRGHMPLELINFGRGSIKIIPYVPICQVMFIPLSSEPERSYGDGGLSSKYMNDDGGPSYWWRDKRIKQLQVTLGESDVGERVQNEILEMIGPRDPDLIERFEMMIRTLPIQDLTNSAEILELFAAREDQIRFRNRLLHAIQIGAAPFLLAASIGAIFSQPFGWPHFALWGLTVLSIPFSIAGFRSVPIDYFGTKEMDLIRRQWSDVHSAQ
jgi:deoxycytidine triphosphate deaminase